MKVVSTLATAVALVALASACAQKKAPAEKETAAPQAPAPKVMLPSLADDAPAQPGDVKEKQPRFGEAAVYVDGKAVGVIRSTELPADLKGRLVEVGGGVKVTRWSFVDYARALGYDAKRIKALHLYGGQRAVVVDQAEVARIGDRIMFSFVQGDRGKPRVHWPAVKLNVNSTIDMVSNVAFYIEKEPPHLDARGELVMPDGTKAAGKVPYAPEEQGNGTRVYVDGKLVGLVKRKKLTNDLLVRKAPEADHAAAKTAPAAPESGEDHFSILAYAGKLDPKALQAASIDLVAGDDIIGHLQGDQARSLTFNVPPRNRGQAVVDVPSNGSLQRARVSAVQIYVTSTPPSRPVVKIDEAPEAAPRTAPAGAAAEE